MTSQVLSRYTGRSRGRLSLSGMCQFLTLGRALGTILLERHLWAFLEDLQTQGGRQGSKLRADPGTQTAEVLLNSAGRGRTLAWTRAATSSSRGQWPLERGLKKVLRGGSPRYGMLKTPRGLEAQRSLPLLFFIRDMHMLCSLGWNSLVFSIEFPRGMGSPWHGQGTPDPQMNSGCVQCNHVAECEPQGCLQGSDRTSWGSWRTFLSCKWFGVFFEVRYWVLGEKKIDILVFHIHFHMLCTLLFLYCEASRELSKSWNYPVFALTVRVKPTCSEWVIF